MGKFLQKNIFSFKTKCINSKLFSIYTPDSDNQYADNLDKLNLQKRISLVNHAYTHTHFYRKIYDSNLISPENIKTDSDFFKLPIVRRSDIKNHFEEFISYNVNKKNYYKATTGGSTGQPITVLHDRRFPLTYIQWRVLEWWGIKPYENAAFIYRLRRTGIDKILNTLLWWPTKRIFLDAASMERKNILNFIDQFNNVKPTLLQGYVGAVYEFAKFVKENNINIHYPVAVWVTSAPLTEHQRSFMQKVFNAPVYDQYGTCEIMWLAAECKERNGLHMMSDIRYIEFVDENNKPVKPGTSGRILLTDLSNYAFPLIRYEIGDVGKALNYECKCGLKLPLMGKVQGRISDIIKTPSDIVISGEYLTTIFDKYPEAVNEFQIFQNKDFTVTLSYVPNIHKDIDKIIDKIILDLKQRTNNEIDIKAKKVNEISHLKGKTKFIISELT